jgi:hypothetical protein
MKLLTKDLQSTETMRDMVFDCITLVKMPTVVFWVVTPCTFIGVTKGEKYYPHLLPLRWR